MTSLRAILALLLCLAWFGWWGPRTAAELVEAQARARSTADLRDVVLGLAAARRDLPEALPVGEEARELAALVEEALSLEAAKADWPLRALGALGPAARELAASAPGELLPRSRELPQVPPEVLEIVDHLGRQVGSGAGLAAPLSAPATAWPGATSQEVARGVWAAVREGVSDEEAAGVLAAALVGMEAHHRQPALLEELLDRLDPELVALGQAIPVDPRVDVLERYAPAALEGLR